MSRSSTRSVAWTAVGYAASPAAGVLSAPLLARGLGVDGRGQLAAAAAPLLLGSLIAAFGLPESIIYFLARLPQQGGRLFRAAFVGLTVAGITSTVAVWILAPHLTSDAHVISLIRIAIVALLPTLWLSGVRSLFSVWDKWKLIACERMLGSGSRLVGFVALLALDTLTPLSATLVWAASSWIGVVVYLPTLVSGRSPWATTSAQQPAAPPLSRRERRAGRNNIRRMPSYSVRVWVGALSGILLQRVDQFLMIPLASDRQLGLYVVAVTIADASQVLNGPVRDVFFARQSSIPDNFALARATRISTLLTALVVVIGAVLVVPAIPLFFGSEFSAAIPATQILLLASLLGTPGSVAATAFASRGRPGVRSLLLTISMLVNLVAVVALVPMWGAVGAALATATGSLLSALLVAIVVRRMYGIRMRSIVLPQRADFVFVAKMATRTAHKLPAISR